MYTSEIHPSHPNRLKAPRCYICLRRVLSPISTLWLMGDSSRRWETPTGRGEVSSSRGWRENLAPIFTHFPFASHFWWEQEVGVGGGAVTQKLRRKVGSRQPRMRGHCCKPVLLAPNQARSVPSPSSSGQETYCPLLLRRGVGCLRGGLGTPSNANNLRWVVITDKPSQVRRNQTDIGPLLPATQRVRSFLQRISFSFFFQTLLV